jgi:hypothetical protein
MSLAPQKYTANTGRRFMDVAAGKPMKPPIPKMQQHQVAAAQGARASAPMVQVTTFINEERSYV